MSLNWRKVKSPGRVLLDFKPSGQFQINLKEGDKVEIIEEASGWYKGYVQGNEDKVGIFPSSYVFLGDTRKKRALSKPLSTPPNNINNENNNNNTDKDKEIENKKSFPRNQNLEKIISKESVKHEIYERLSKWVITQHTLLIEGSINKYFQIKEKSSILLDLWSYYNNNNSISEYTSIVTLIDNCRQIDEGYIVPKGSNRQPILLKKTKIIRLYIIHQSLDGDSINQEKSSLWVKIINSRKEKLRIIKNIRKSEMVSLKSGNYSITLSVKAILFEMTEDKILEFLIFSRKKDKFITENYILKINVNGFPEGENSFDKAKTIFTNISDKDYQDDLFLVCKIYRIGKLEHDKKKKNTKVKSKHKRPYGCICIPISNINIDHIMNKEYTPSENYCNITLFEKESDFPYLHKIIIRKMGEVSSIKNTKVIIMSLSLKYDNENNSNQSLKYNVTRKLLYDLAISPEIDRHEIYIELIRGRFSQETLKYVNGKPKIGSDNKQKNIMIKVEIKDSFGKIINNCIYSGSRTVSISEYNSCVIYHSLNPEYRECFYASLPGDLMNSSHLYITYYHIDSKSTSNMIPFGFSFISLAFVTTGEIILNGIHELEVYFPIKNFQNSAKPLYLNVNKHSSLLKRKDIFFISTHLCSTSHTQDLTLHKLFSYQEYNKSLEAILAKFLTLKGDIYIHYIRIIMDSLLSILTSKENHKILFLTFRCILYTISSVIFFKGMSDIGQKYLNIYIKKIFDKYDAIKILSNFCIECFNDPLKHYEEIFLICRCGEYIVKFFHVGKEKGNDANKDSYEKFAYLIYNDFINIIYMDKKELKQIHSILLANLPKFLNEVRVLLDKSKFCEICVKCISAFQKCNGKHESCCQKLDCIYEMLENCFMGDEEIYERVFSVLISIIDIHVKIDMVEDYTMAYISVKLLKKFLCVVTEFKNPIKSFKKAKNVIFDLTFFINKLYLQTKNEEQPKINKTWREKYQSEFLVDSIICLLAIFYELHEEQINQFFESLNVSRKEYVKALMEFCLRNIKENIFNKLWIMLRISEIQVIYKISKLLSQVIQNKFMTAETFDSEICTKFLDLIISLFSDQLFIHDDISQQKLYYLKENLKISKSDIKKLILDYFQSFKSHKLEFVVLFIKKLFVLVSNQDKEGIEISKIIYEDLLQLEYKKTKNFIDIKSAVINSFYFLLPNHKNNCDIFVKNIIAFQGKSSDDPKTQFMEQVERIYQYMIDIKNTSLKENTDKKISLYIRLLDTLREKNINKTVICNYIFGLTKLYTALNNWVEAGITSMEHIEFLKWSSDHVEELDKYKESTEEKRKEELYYETIEYFDKGGDYERAIELCQDLKDRYKNETFDYKKMSLILDKESSFYKKKSENVRIHPNYYRVIFYGDFEESIKKFEWVYKGYKREQITRFSDRMKGNYADSKIIMSTDTPKEDFLKDNKKVISISILTVSSRSALYHEEDTDNIKNKNKMSMDSLNYEKNNQVNVFFFKKVLQKGKKDTDNIFRDLWAIKTFVISKYRFPCNQIKSPIIEKQTINVHPIENAIEAIENKTDELMTSVEKIMKSPEENIDVKPLTMNLQGIIDAAVSGGNKLYVDAFFAKSSGYLKKNPDQLENIGKLKMSMYIQQEKLRYSLGILHKLGGDLYNDLHKHLNEMFLKAESKNKEYLKECEEKVGK